MQSYIEHFSWLDILIWLLGGTVFLCQAAAIVLLRTGVLSSSKPVHLDTLKPRYHLIGRLSSVAVDALPLLGLLGTVAALLVTFTGMAGGPVTSSVVADFAPGLTTTISGLVTALLNLICLQLVYVPTMRNYFGENS